MWEVMSAISSAVVAVGIVVIFWQAKMLRRDSKLNAFNSLLESWGGEEERKARRFILGEFEFDGNLSELSEDQAGRVEVILAKCNRISLMASEGLVSKEDILRLVGRSMIRCWDRLEGFVKARRKQAGESEGGEEWGYMYSFQQFVSENRTRVGLGKSSSG